MSGAGCSVQVVVPSEDRSGPTLPGDGPEMGDPHQDEHQLGDPGPLPEVCGTDRIFGVGTTWMDEGPATAETRWLRCLTPETDALAGRFVSAVHETNLPKMDGTQVAEADRYYDYAATDRRANQPATYWVMTEMALAHHAADTTLIPPSAVEVFTGPFFVFDSFYGTDAVTLGRAGLSGTRLDVDIAAHEYGHHLISTLAPGIEVSTLHEGIADYLACAFTDDPRFMDALPAALARPCDNDHAWPADALDTHQACQLLEQGFASAGWTEKYASEYGAIEACLAMESPYLLEGHQTGMIVSGALWALHEGIGAARFLPLLHEALRRVPVEVEGDFGMLTTALLAADAELYDGENHQALVDELGARGMSADVGLAAHEGHVGYACLMTPEHEALGLLPAGPLLPHPRRARAERSSGKGSAAGAGQ
ncbi:MAG: hypothetical protein WKG00_20370 [Polyangiaceae bacterium]